MVDLPKKMRALVAHDPKDYRIEEVDVPRAGEREIIIKVEACGICAGDTKSYLGAPRFWGEEGRPSYIKAPVIPGHEFIGHIVELGPNVKGDFQIGDRVTSDQIVPCWDCKFCNSGRYWMCQKHDVYGFQYNVNGGMAEYMRLPKEAIVHKLPKDLPMEAAVLVEPYACAKHCIDRSQVGNEDFVVLSGVGCLGLGMIGCLKLRNPAKLVVLDINDQRLELAKKFGADIVMNPAKEKITPKIMEMTGGYGCDVYIEASGHPSSVQQGLDIIRKLGRFVEFSVFGHPTTADWSIISDEKELDLLGVHLSPYCFPSVIEWIADGRLPTEGVVSHKFPLEKWKEGFELALKGEGAVRVVLVP